MNSLCQELSNLLREIVKPTFVNQEVIDQKKLRINDLLDEINTLIQQKITNLRETNNIDEIKDADILINQKFLPTFSDLVQSQQEFESLLAEEKEKAYLKLNSIDSLVTDVCENDDELEKVNNIIDELRCAFFNDYSALLYTAEDLDSELKKLYKTYSATLFARVLEANKN